VRAETARDLLTVSARLTTHTSGTDARVLLMQYF
jgi:hypothetical protein